MPSIAISRLSESTTAVVDQLNVLVPQLKSSWDPITTAGLASVIESPTQVYVARRENVIVGLALLVPHRHLPGLRYHIEDVVVDKPFRRLGIARRLLTTAMDNAPADVISFDLRSHRIRQAAHSLYVDLGFETSDTTVFRKTVRPPPAAVTDQGPEVSQ